MDPVLASVRRIPRSGKLQEVLQHQVAMLGGDALGVKLHAMNGQGPVRKPHHQPVACLGGHRKLGGHGMSLHYERMIPRGLERPVDAAEDTLALMRDLGKLAVHRHRRAHHLAADEADAIDYVKALLSYLPSNNLEDPPSYDEPAVLDTSAEIVDGESGATIRPGILTMVVSAVPDDSAALAERARANGAVLLGTGPVETPWGDRNVRLSAPRICS